MQETGHHRMRLERPITVEFTPAFFITGAFEWCQRNGIAVKYEDVAAQFENLKASPEPSTAAPPPPAPAPAASAPAPTTTTRRGRGAAAAAEETPPPPKGRRGTTKKAKNPNRVAGGKQAWAVRQSRKTETGEAPAADASADDKTPKYKVKRLSRRGRSQGERGWLTKVENYMAEHGVTREEAGRALMAGTRAARGKKRSSRRGGGTRRQTTTTAAAPAGTSAPASA